MEDTGKRLNKYISDAGICSRREADRLIMAGKVEIRRKSRKDEPDNPRIKASTGEKVFRGDTVYVEGRELPKKEPDRVYYLYHKPKGVICTADPETPDNIIDAAGVPQRVSYAGRLDRDSSGLIVLTNDGALIDGMMRASGRHEKEYVCTVDKPVTQEFILAMSQGVKILLDDDEHLRKNPKGVYVTTRPCKVRQTGDRRFTIVLTQGYNRQIRRMCKTFGMNVTALVRTRLMNLRLGAMKPGELRKLTQAEVEALYGEIRKSGKTAGSGTDGKAAAAFRRKNRR